MAALARPLRQRYWQFVWALRAGARPSGAGWRRGQVVDFSGRARGHGTTCNMASGRCSASEGLWIWTRGAALGLRARGAGWSGTRRPMCTRRNLFDRSSLPQESRQDSALCQGADRDRRLQFPVQPGPGRYLVVTAGGGLDYHLKHRIYIRAADVEYQIWPQFTYGGTTSQ